MLPRRGSHGARRAAAAAAAAAAATAADFIAAAAAAATACAAAAATACAAAVSACSTDRGGVVGSPANQKRGPEGETNERDRLQEGSRKVPGRV